MGKLVDVYNEAAKKAREKKSSYESPIIKIINPDGDIYSTQDEVLEVDDSLAERLVKEGIAELSDKQAMLKYETGAIQAKVAKFHKKDEKEFQGKLNIVNYYYNTEQYYKQQPFFYDASGLFWFWNNEQNKYEIWDEIDIMNNFDDSFELMGETVNAKLKLHYIEAFKRVGRKNIPKDSPKKWIQFKNLAYSLSSGKIYKVTPEYFFTNPIPWELSTSSETPEMDKLLTEWVGEKYLKTMYEIIAYCCYSDYPIQLLFCFYGSGRNGKSRFQALQNKFIGSSNICSTELDTLLTSRFELFKLYKRLVCSMGETNYGLLSRTSMLKKLVGGDIIGYEKKNKDPFDDTNYAKIIISSNSLPTSSDTSEGFYRRWLIVDFPNEFPEGKDVLLRIPEYEYNNLAKKITKILPELLERGMFTNQGDIKERKLKYLMASNPLSLFIDECCDKKDNGYVSYNELFTAYVKYLLNNKKRRIKMPEFKMALEDEGFWIERTTKKNYDYDNEGNPMFRSGNWVNGLVLKDKWEELCKKCK